MNNKIFNNKILRIIVFTLSLLLLIILIHKIVKKYLLTKENFNPGGAKNYDDMLNMSFKLNKDAEGIVKSDNENKDSDKENKDSN